jgi:hypothetical protein
VIVVSALTTMRMGAQAERYLASNYFSGTVAKELTIATRDGQVLSVIEIPVGVMLSVQLVGGEFRGPQGKSGVPTIFSGDVHIRTRPVGSGPVMTQMMSAPFRLDVQNVVVTIVTKP